MSTQPSTPSNCPLCRQNNLLKEIVIADTADAYLIRAYNSPGNYLLIPTQHTESLADLPDNWWVSVKALLTHLPDLGNDYNIAINIGAQAGQSIKHIHFWVIPRSDGQAASSKGFARLIEEVNQRVS